MNRSSGVGVMVFGFVLIVVGAIMKYAVTAKVSGFSVDKAGLIMLLVGIGLAVVGMVMLVVGGRSGHRTQTDIRQTPSGQQRTEQQDDWGTP